MVSIAGMVVNIVGIYTLIIIAILANLLTLILYNYAANQPGGSGVAMIFTLVWMPALWLTTIVMTIIISVIKKSLAIPKPGKQLHREHNHGAQGESTAVDRLRS